MTYAKSNGIFKKLGALVMALGLTCALAVSASALDVYAQYTPSLSVDAPVPHTLNFFVEGGTTVTSDGDTDTVVMELENPAEIVVTVGGHDITATGSITSATATAETEDEGYTVDLSDDGKYLTVTCPSDISAEEFAPVITFTVDTGATDHRAVDATLHLSQD